MAEATFSIRPMRREDYSQVQEIYVQGLETGHATYERDAPSWEEFRNRKIEGTVFVAVELNDDSRVLGWVSASPISHREVFHGVVEDSIYIRNGVQGRGIAGGLLDKLIEVCQDLGKWGIHSWIFPENQGSAKLHESRGFERVGTLRHLAKMPYGELKGQWRDTVIWEKLLPKPDIEV